MVHERLRFALERLGPGEWLLFERFASEFLVEEFPNIRTTASASGDRGRDGELFAPPGQISVGFQYSVSEDWRSKIRDTVKKVTGNKLGYARLVYCTSQRIGAEADDLRNEIWRTNQIQLDIRDREWFCEREVTTLQRQVSAEELAVRIVDPVLTPRAIADAVGAPLTSAEGRVALVHLAMNASDRAGDSNLTKSSFDALVRAALVETSADATMSAAQVVETVRSLVPHGAANQVRDLTMSALQRLSKKRGPVKHRTDTDGYHLSFQAHEEWKITAAEYLLDQAALDADLAAGAFGYVDELDANYDELLSEARLLRECLEGLLLRRGEEFVAAVEAKDSSELVLEDLSAHLQLQGHPLRLSTDQGAAAIAATIAGPSERSREHMLHLLDGYTLLAFLHETPDVQKAMSRVFEKAQIWLDTTAVLPLLAETLLDEPSTRAQTVLLRAAVESGVQLHVTGGVIEEVRYHLEKARLYSINSTSWRSRVPFIFTAYLFSGRDPRDFRAWTSEFMGDMNPEQDIEDYLSFHYQIDRVDLAEVAEAAPANLRAAVKELFQSVHERRRGGQNGEDLIDRLAMHDLENAVGVIQLRHGAKSPLGYEVWWLTLDRKAFGLHRWLREQLGTGAPASPVLSPDYLSQLLRLGPARRSLGSQSAQLPLAVDLSKFDRIPPELLSVARSTRAAMDGHDELRIRREVRDALTRMQISTRPKRDYSAEVESAVLDSMRVAD